MQNGSLYLCYVSPFSWTGSLGLTQQLVRNADSPPPPDLLN